VSVAELAAAAGVTRPILYDHFGDRAGIAAALVQRYTSGLASTLTPLFARPVSLRHALHDGIEVFCRFVESEPDVYRFLTTAPTASDAASMGIEVGRRVGEALSAALSAAGRDPTIAPVWGYAILGMVFGAAEAWTATRAVPRHVLVDQLTELITAGLAGAGIADTVGPFA
jgi:AcrR family transcriptional regulator